MLDKSHGVVACAHCHVPHADTTCPYCQRLVCKSCLGPVGCSVPHPEELRLGRGRRLLRVDDAARHGQVGYALTRGSEAWRLRHKEVFGLRPHTYEELPVELRGEAAVNGGVLVQAAWSYEFFSFANEDHKDYLTPLLFVADVTEHGLFGVRFIKRSIVHVAADTRVSEDGKTALLVSASQVDIVDITGERKPRTVDFKGELIQCCALSQQADLFALGIFGRVLVYRLSTARRVGELILEGQDIAAVAVGMGRCVVVDGNKGLHLLEQQRREGEERWVEHGDVREKLAHALRPNELSMSADGRLLAYQHKRKRVLLRTVDEQGVGEPVQELRAHTDRVNLVQFVRRGQMLVSADQDNRVWFWPREGDRLISGE
ncbi:MAG: hypothetical protein JRH20_03145 [Deltaproteobacteria bacterium]|nr:hypothetical protein [Deltaproteobacteria bacterium]